MQRRIAMALLEITVVKPTCKLIFNKLYKYKTQSVRLTRHDTRGGET